jgi:hypothetical protein
MIGRVYLSMLSVPKNLGADAVQVTASLQKVWRFGR